MTTVYATEKPFGIDERAFEISGSYDSHRVRVLAAPSKQEGKYLFSYGHSVPSSYDPANNVWRNFPTIRIAKLKNEDEARAAAVNIIRKRLAETVDKKVENVKVVLRP